MGNVELIIEPSKKKKQTNKYRTKTNETQYQETTIML